MRFTVARMRITVLGVWGCYAMKGVGADPTPGVIQNTEMDNQKGGLVNAISNLCFRPVRFTVVQMRITVPGVWASTPSTEVGADLTLGVIQSKDNIIRRGVW